MMIDENKPVALLTFKELMEALQEVFRKNSEAQVAKNELQVLMSQEEAAEYLGVSVASMYQYVHKGLPVSKKGKYNFFKKQDIDSWFKGRTRRRKKVVFMQTN